MMKPRFLKTAYTSWLLFSLLILSTFSWTAAASGELSATVDRNQIGLEETFQLMVRYNEQVMFDEPDFSLLNQDFDVLSNRRSNQYKSINGRAESWTQWALTLAPKRAGKLLVPSFELDGAFSDAIEINVEKTAPTSASSDQPVFLQAELETDSAYVQQQVLYTIRLFTRVGITSVNRSDFIVDNALMKQLDENQYQKTINGQTYIVVEIAYALFPQQSGELNIPSTLWEVTLQGRNSLYDPFNRGGQRLRLRTQAHTLYVKPKPDSYTANQWLPANSLQLKQEWSNDPETFKVGEPITRRVMIEANGLMASQLPPLTVKDVDGLKYYPDQPQSNETLSTDGVLTQKTESYAIVPSQPGSYTLPAITLNWWDNKAKKELTATLPEQTIQVSASRELSALPAAPQNSVELASSDESTTPAIDSKNGKLWFYTSIIFILLTILFAGLWLRERRLREKAKTDRPAADLSTSPASAPEKQQFKLLQKAIQQNQPGQIRATLLQWGESYYQQFPPSQRPSGTITLAQLASESDALTYAIEQLETALYHAESSSQFDGHQLMAAVQALRETARRSSEADNNQSLKPMYANGQSR